VPPRSAGGHPDWPARRPQRTEGLLAARPDAVRRDVLRDGSGRRPVVRRTPSRVRRFADRWGWRAYAIPFRTIATLAVLGDLAGRPVGPADTASATSSVPPPSVAAPVTSASTAPPATDVDEAPAAQPPATGHQPYVERGAGTVSVVDGVSQVYGSGPLRRFVVEVEDGIDVDGAEFAAAVEHTLADPRSWGHGGQMSFQRVGVAEAAAGNYAFKVTLVSPGNMETYCPGVGTGGYTSCRYGERAVINLARWATAVPDYQGDIATYRLYVVNHEVGHALGNGHEQCPGPGAVAPVMQQQTLGLNGCVKNAWPYP
jgi:hypothetical protein